MCDLDTMREEWARKPSPILRNDMDVLRSAPSAPLCGARAGNPSPAKAGPGATGTTRRAWRELVLTMVKIDAAFLIVFALAWWLVR